MRANPVIHRLVFRPVLAALLARLRRLCLLSTSAVIVVSAGCSGAGLYQGPAHEIVLSDVGLADASGQSSAVQRRMIVDAARAVLLDEGFRVDRVDAARGVVTSSYQSVLSGGRLSGTLSGTVSATINRHEHAVRVETDPVGKLRVRVLVRRLVGAEQQIETETMSLGSRSRSIGPDGRLEARVSSTVLGEDGELARRIGRAIEARMKQLSERAD